MTAPERLRLPGLAAHRPAGGRRQVLSSLGPSPAGVRSLARRAVRIRHALVAPQTLQGKTVGICFRKTATRSAG